MDTLQWVMAGVAGVSLILAGVTAPVRWPAGMWMSGLYTATVVVAVWLLITGTADTGPVIWLCIGVAIGAANYAVRHNRERRRVGREIAAKWAADRARLDMERRERLAAGRMAEEALADLQRRDDADPTMPPRWAEGGY